VSHFKGNGAMFIFDVLPWQPFVVFIIKTKSGILVRTTKEMEYFGGK
jgi:hypothetical protein